MENHFHLVLETPKPNLVAGMKWLLGTYTIRFNRRHGLTGHLFAGRYKSLVIDGDSPGYLRTVSVYVHLNPARAGMIPANQRLVSYAWSSYPFYIQRPARRPIWLRVDRVLGGLGIPRDSTAGRRRFEEIMEAQRARDSSKTYDPIRHGWYLGEREFRKELLAQVSQRSGTNHYGEELLESDAQKAERVLREGLEALGWGDGELACRAKGDAGKVALARRLRTETTMPYRWIAERLNMGVPSYVADLLRVAERRR